jgi:DNA-binding CsgD family transcriptional regulator
MLRMLRTEEIYDAALDDEIFAQLASSMAGTIGARSGVIHWKNASEITEEISYSGYFSSADMAAFERDFANDDLWSVAINAPEHANRVWDCEQLVPESVYKSSRIYNEWVRPMGDDTYHCLGAVIRTGSEVGEIGFHRGKDGKAFGQDTVEAMNEGLSHLRRMISIRSKLIAGERQRTAAGAASDASVHAVLTLTAQGRLLHANEAAEELLGRDDALRMRGGRLAARIAKDQSALQAAIARAVSSEGIAASSLWLHRPKGDPYELSVTSANTGGNGRQIIVVVTQHPLRDSSICARIRTLYGLTQAEAEVAVRLAEGASIQQICDERTSTISTVRSQLKSINSKTGCTRQSQLVARIGQLPRFRLSP